MSDNRGKQEGADTATGNGDSHGNTAAFLEVEAHNGNAGDVGETDANACKNIFLYNKGFYGNDIALSRKKKETDNQRKML